ncbi:MAG: hypothetical protein JSU81_01105 [Candidatus Coatesbacteria bacterium]|nr:MAG: hypothetical protein JSU81_01105 [Candidatus Coatesbacteria bacterium]
MRLRRSYIVSAVAALALGLATLVITGCEEDEPEITRPKVDYLNQTFALLVCDGNGNADTSEPTTNWDHDGAVTCTLAWNLEETGDAAGTMVPVTYVYDDYPLIDGVAEKLGPKGGDWYLWETTPWTIIKTAPVVGSGSKVKEVWVKALYTYVNPPRIWFFFRWEDPTHTIQPTKSQGERPVGGTMHYYWLQAPNSQIPAEGFNNNRVYESQDDWLALVFSTWFIWNTNNKGKDWKLKPRYWLNLDPENPCPNPIEPPDFDGYDWEIYETVPGFQQRGLDAIRGAGDIVYNTRPNSTNDPNSPYYDYWYDTGTYKGIKAVGPGPVCDMWYFSASRTNYTATGGWDDSEAAFLFDCHIDPDGFNYPEIGSLQNTESLDEWLPFDDGIVGVGPNGGFASVPSFMAPDDPEYNPPGAYYIWGTQLTAPEFNYQTPFPPEGGARISGWLHRPALGSVSDVVGRITWQQPGREWYRPWEGQNGGTMKENQYGKDWHYCLEITRDIGTLPKIDPAEDVLLGIFKSHPGK